MSKRKLILISLVILIATSIIWMPLTVYAPQQTTWTSSNTMWKR
jgi:hypothetical protein